MYGAYGFFCTFQIDQASSGFDQIIAFVENAAITKRWWWHFNLHSRPPVSEDFEDFATKQEFELFISFQISSRASIHNGLELGLVRMD